MWFNPRFLLLVIANRYLTSEISKSFFHLRQLGIGRDIRAIGCYAIGIDLRLGRFVDLLLALAESCPSNQRPVRLHCDPSVLGNPFLSTLGNLPKSAALNLITNMILSHLDLDIISDPRISTIVWQSVSLHRDKPCETPVNPMT